MPGAAERMHIAMMGVKGIPHPGGIECVVEQLGSRLVARGHRVTVYVRPHYTPASASEYRGMELIHLPSVRNRNFDALTHSAMATLHLARAGADIAHIHSIGLSIFAAPLRLLNIPTVVQSHGLDWQRKKWGTVAKCYLRVTDATTALLPCATTVVSKKLQAYYKTRFHRDVWYIPNGVPQSYRLAPREILRLGLMGDDYILFGSRLVPEKGCHYLLEAYRGLTNKNKKLVIAGDSNYGDRYAEDLKRFASPDVLFLGFVTGRLFQELLSNAALYVLPSEIEGLSTGLLEAMSYGNCVLTSDIEENLEAIGDAGWTFRNGDPSDLRAKLEFLLRNDRVVREYRVRACEHARRAYDWDRITDEYESLYRSLI